MADDEVLSGRHFFPHQHGKNFVGFGRIGNGDLLLSWRFISGYVLFFFRIAIRTAANMPTNIMVGIM